MRDQNTLDALSQRDSVSSISAESSNTEHTSDLIKKIAVFDFDGTVISGQRQEEARELVVGALTQYSVEFANAVMHDFHREVIEGMYRPQALEEVRRRQAEGCCVLLVSATFEPIAELAAQKLGVDAFLATKMQVGADGHYTSKVDGPVIEGAQKLVSATEWCNQRFGQGNWEIAYAYGDHYSDATLLSAAQTPCAVCPGPTLARLANKRGWKILNW